MKRLSRIWLTMALLVLRGSEALAQGAISPANGRTFVVVADGAGGYSTLFDNLSEAYAPRALVPRRPVICRIPWAVDGDNLNDYRDGRRHLMGAFKMVCEVQRIRQCAPDSPIVLIGYSAGASVVILAAERLPPSTVERIILLGPSVPASYDVRRCLGASKLGLDSFNVPGDEFMMEMEERFGAPYERPGTRLACTTGFLIADPSSCLARDPLLLGKLRQYNFGCLPTGHFGTVTPGFLTRNVLPLIPWASVTTMQK